MDRRKMINIIDRPISKGKAEVSLSAFSFMFSELIQYLEGRVSEITELERRLSLVGYSVGQKLLELIIFRERYWKREIKLVGILSFIHSTVWKVLFSKQADSLERSTDKEDEYMIIENQPIVSKYISTPKDRSGLNCAAYVAGIIQGILDSADFKTEKVTAHTIGVEEKRPRTVFLIKFQPEVIERDKRLGN
eukprot:TRINITY_DN1834_c0_g1_i2.p2 TRINITY_DN1834_c0_g1~~TRINITY_DN1834_c0_g1_i2.p2  ORF type:complete len:192 (-),score=41.40 TRINITY_DN1834_c0_g1_i2:1065-1640(-)